MTTFKKGEGSLCYGPLDRVECWAYANSMTNTTCESCTFGPGQTYQLLADVPDMGRRAGETVTLCDSCADGGRSILRPHAWEPVKFLYPPVREHHTEKGI